MVQRTVLKVDISCPKCKKKLLKSVSALEGVDKIEADEGKGTLTVTGNADPYRIIIQVRKAGKHAEVVTVGPPPAPPKVEKKPDEKKPDDKKPDPKVAVYCPPYGYYPEYPQVVYVPVNRCYEPSPECSIM